MATRAEKLYLEQIIAAHRSLIGHSRRFAFADMETFIDPSMQNYCYKFTIIDLREDDVVKAERIVRFKMPIGDSFDLKKVVLTLDRELRQRPSAWARRDETNKFFDVLEFAQDIAKHR